VAGQVRSRSWPSPTPRRPCRPVRHRCRWSGARRRSGCGTRPVRLPRLPYRWMWLFSFRAGSLACMSSTDRQASGLGG